MQAEIFEFKIKKYQDVLDKNDRPIPGYSRHVPTGNIYYRKTFKKLGIPSLHVSTGETTLGKAKTKIDMLVQQHINKHLGINDSHVFSGRRGKKSFQSVAQEVLTRVTPLRRAKTQRKHKDFIDDLVDAFGQYNIDSITAREFELWIEKLRKTSDRTTFMDYAKHMNLVMRFAYNEKYCQHLIKFANPDSVQDNPGRVYTDAEIKSLWEVMNDTTQDQFVLSYECMMRLREVLHLTWERVDLKTGIITLRPADVKTGSKTGKGREFQMSPGALERLRARFKNRSPDALYVFPSRFDPLKPADDNRAAWGKAKENAKIEDPARWHDLRHTAITKALLVAKMKPIEVSEYAGVSLGTIQRVYLHSTAEHTQSVAGAISIDKIKKTKKIHNQGVNAVRTGK